MNMLIQETQNFRKPTMLIFFRYLRKKAFADYKAYIYAFNAFKVYIYAHFNENSTVFIILNPIQDEVLTPNPLR